MLNLMYRESFIACVCYNSQCHRHGQLRLILIG